MSQNEKMIKKVCLNPFFDAVFLELGNIKIKKMTSWVTFIISLCDCLHLLTRDLTSTIIIG